MIRDASLRLPDGRTLSYAHAGPASADVVVVFHGTPGSRLAARPLDGWASERGARVLCHDRAGYGRSDRARHASVRAASGDAVALLDALGVERAGVVGVSGGAPYALAVGAAAPERVRAIAVASAVTGAEPRAAGDLEGALRDAAAALVGDPDGAIDLMLAGLSEADRAVAASPPVRAHLVESTVEAVRAGHGGWLDDDVLAATAWGFEPRDVRAPVRLWHGDRDGIAPLRDVEELAAALPDARLVVLRGEGHLGAARRLPELADAALA